MADAMRFDQKLVLLKAEVEYGVDPLPTAATNAILTRNFQLTPIAGDRRVRELDVPSTGGRPSRLDNPRGEFSFEVEMTGAGSTGGEIPPPYGLALRLAGLAEVVTADGVTGDGTGNVSYSRIESGFESGTLYTWFGENQHKLPGARFNLQGTLTAGQDPFWAFNGAGLFVPVLKVAIPANADHSAFQLPDPVDDANTNVVLAGQTLDMSSFTFNLQNDVAMKVRTDMRQVRVRNNGADGTLVFTAPKVDVIDFFDKARNTTQEAMTVTHGTAPGKMVEIASPRVEIGEPTYQDDDGDLMLSVPVRLISDGVTPELTLKFT